MAAELAQAMPRAGAADAATGESDAQSSPQDPRAATLARLATTFKARGHQFMEHTDGLFMHGALYDGPLKKPKTLWRSERKPRKDHNASSWLTASEFEDQPDVMRAKVAQLAQLMRISRRTVVYSGAGISASVVGQAALSGTNKVGWTGCKTAAQPTPTHHALSLLGRSGLIHGWVQQNHDGLPQKAGFPQELICEVHGSWFDPSNPVVKYSGCLKNHEYNWMERETAEADLVLVMGTSLGGLCADQVATECADRASEGASLGPIIINLQQTDVDGQMSLKLSGKTDDVLGMLLEALGLPRPDASNAVKWPLVHAALVPYDANGKRLPEGSDTPWMWLDLRPGAKVKLTKGHNHQGAKQPNTMHIGAKKGQKFQGKELANVGPGFGTVSKRDEETDSFKLSIEGAIIRMGVWWLDAAARGGPQLLPLVNQVPVFADCKDTAIVGRLQAAATEAAAAAHAPSSDPRSRPLASSSAASHSPESGELQLARAVGSVRTTRKALLDVGKR